MKSKGKTGEKDGTQNEWKKEERENSTKQTQTADKKVSGTREKKE